MGKLGSTTLTVDNIEWEQGSDKINKGDEVSLDWLISWDERKKQFDLLEDTTRFDTKVKVVIDKISVMEGTWQTRADITKTKGQKTSLYELLPWLDQSRPIIASEDIEKGDKLEVNLETG